MLFDVVVKNGGPVSPRSARGMGKDAELIVGNRQSVLVLAPVFMQLSINRHSAHCCRMWRVFMAIRMQQSVVMHLDWGQSNRVQGCSRLGAMLLIGP